MEWKLEANERCLHRGWGGGSPHDSDSNLRFVLKRSDVGIMIRTICLMATEVGLRMNRMEEVISPWIFPMEATTR